ncbi:MAG: hypothetical protein KBD62_35140 [Kofleriaceae bacterium]|nr:hypothetical protein [Kofleriaceae bacterium]
MAGPFDAFDPSQLSTVQGPNGPFSVPSPLASRFQPPLAIPPIAGAPAPQAAPLTVGGIPLPPDMAAKFAPAPQPEAPVPVAAPSAHVAPAQPPQPQRPQDPFAVAQARTEAALGERRQAAIDSGAAEAAGAEAEADAIAEGNRQADLARAAAAKQLEQDQAEQKRLGVDLEASRKAYADHKVDQARFWHDSSTGNKVLMGIGLALSAAGSVLKREGAKNPALDMILGAVKQDIALQLADRDKLLTDVNQKSSAVDRAMTATRDNQATMAALTAGALDRVKGQVTEIATRTKSGLAKANALDLAGQLDGLAAKSMDDALQGAWARKKDDQQLALQRQNTAIAGGNLALAGKRFEEDKRQFDASRADRLYAEAMDAVQAGNANMAKMSLKSMSPQDAKVMQEMDIKERQQQVFAPPARKLDPKTGAVSYEKQLARNADGSLFKIPDEKAAGEMKSKMAGAIMYSGAIDQLVEWRKAHGWESSTWNSSDRQTAEVLMNNLILAKKNAEKLGAISQSDLALVEGAIGTGDPGSMRDPTDALMKGREMVWSGVNADMRAQGYDGADVFIDPPKPIEESEASRLNRDIGDQDRGPARALDTIAANVDEGTMGRDRGRATGKAITAVSALALSARGRDADPEAILAIRKRADDPDPAIRTLARNLIDRYQIDVADPHWRTDSLSQRFVDTVAGKGR